MATTTRARRSVAASRPRRAPRARSRTRSVQRERGGHRVPEALRPLLVMVRSVASTCPLRGHYAPHRGATRAGQALTGQCENASALFHLLAGGTRYGWRMMRLGGEVWSLGPHYFVQHVSGAIVDPTADQFPVGEPIPYGLARGQSAGGFRKVPHDALGGLDVRGQTTTRAALDAAHRLGVGPRRVDHEAGAAIAAARAWSLENLEAL